MFYTKLYHRILFYCIFIYVAIGGVRLDDEMSLSSLSSGDEKILNADGTKLDAEPSSQSNAFGAPFYGQQPGQVPAGGDPYFAWRNMYGNYPATGTNFAAPGTSNATSFPSTFGYPQVNGYPAYTDMSTVPSSQNLTHSDQNTQDPYATTIE